MDDFTQEKWYKMTTAELHTATEFFTHPAATRLLAQAGLVANASKAKTVKVLDIGTGMGQVVEMLYEHKGDWEGQVTLGDIDESFLQACKGKVEANGWSESAVKKLDIMALDEPDNSFTHIIANYVVMLLPQPLDALKESVRVLAPGGTLGFTTWAYAGIMYLLQHAQELIPNAPSNRITEASVTTANGEWHYPAYIRAQLESLGTLTDIKIEAYNHKQTAESAKAMSYAMRAVVKMVTADWPKDAAWAMFAKMEEILATDFGDGPAHVWGVALVVTAKKAA